MSYGRYITDASHSFSLKDSANELLKSAQLAFKVKDKQILKEIFVEMKGRQQRRSQRGKSQNPVLNNNIGAVEQYLKEIDIDD
jgi:3-deoxy-D-manno-octulosonic-acid transferase